MVVLDGDLVSKLLSLSPGALDELLDLLGEHSHKQVKAKCIDFDEKALLSGSGAKSKISSS